MKTTTRALLIFMTLLTACGPQNVATLPPKLAATNALISTAVPKAFQTPKPTPLPIDVTEISLDSCRQIVEAKISSAGILEILFQDDDRSTVSIISEFWFSNGRQQTSSVLWSEDTQKAVPFPLPPDALEPKLSTDHRWILFRRDTGKTQSEFWVIGVDGKAEKKFGAVMLTEEMKTSYPDGYFSLDYGWIPNTDKFFYEVDVFIGTDEYTPAINNKFVLVDVNSGKAISLTFPSDMQTFNFAPDGSQMAILTESGLRVLNTQDGQTLFTIQASLNEPTYSPDGKYIVDFIDDGILRIKAQDGGQQIIPLKYTIMSSRTEGPSYGPLPDFLWVDNSTLLLTSLNSEKRYVFPVLQHQPGWTFTVWQIDLAQGITHSIQTFSGDPSSAKISPDQKRLAFLKHEGGAQAKTRDLYVANLATGEILEIIQGGVFEAWFPDSNKYLYAIGIPYPSPGKGDPGTTKANIQYYLGQVGSGEPALMNWNVSELEWASHWWVDQNRLVMNCQIVMFP